MKINGTQVRNWLISFAILALSFSVIYNEAFSFGQEGIFIDSTFIYYTDMILIALSIFVFGYIIGSKYYLIINVERYNRNSFHALVNILLLPIVIISTLVLSQTINPVIGLIAIIVQVLFSILIIALKQENEKFSIKPMRFIIQLVLLLILLVTTLLNNLPFTYFFIDINIIAMITYIYLTIVDIYQAFKIFSI